MKNLIKCYGGGARSLAFTLAEVLITLAIIGVVAALTIPTVVAKYNQHAQYTAFMKMYNTLTNVISLAEGEEGKPSTWLYDYTKPNETLEKYIYPYLKISAQCDTSDNNNVCSVPYDIKTVSGAADNELWQSLNKWVSLQDGSLIAFQLAGEGKKLVMIAMLFDINGKKAPNTLGRDIFYLLYALDDEDDITWGFYDLDKIMEGACEPSNANSSGLSCSTKLLKERAMKY